MARKRKLQTAAPVEQEVGVDEGWSSWLKGTYARYWYVLACMFVDSSVSLQVYVSFEGLTAIALALLVLAVLVAVQVYIYVRVWGAQGRWAPLED